MFKKNPVIVAIEKEQLSLLSELEGIKPDDPQYPRITEQLAALNDLKPKTSGFTKDGLLSAGASLAGILLVLNYEKVGAITSKSFGLVRKP